MADTTQPQWTVSKYDEHTIESAPDRWFGRPSLAVRDDGTWVMVYREAPGHPPSRHSAMHVRFSADAGETWTARNVTLDGARVEGFPHTHSEAKGNVQLGSVTDYDDDLLVHVNENSEPFETWEGCRQLRSSDGGRSWVDEGLVDPDGIEPEAVLLGQDDAVDPETGALYEGVNERRAGRPAENPPAEGYTDRRSGLIRTRDGGHSWEYVNNVTDYGDKTGELGITFVDGDLLALLRVVDDSGTYSRRSPDRGESWGELRTVDSLGVFQKGRLYTPDDIGCDAHDERWVYTVGREVLDFSPDYDRGDERRHVKGSQHTAIAASPDGGETWFEPVQLDEHAWPAPFGDCGYCDLLTRPDGDHYVATYSGPSFTRAADLMGYFLHES
jgi:hypothetical protein